jgi:adenosylmethionine-8-amino-7-oxononanoate aminotransferase
VKGAAYLIDETGKRYLDACGGAAVSSLGHDNKAVRAASSRQRMESISYAHTGLLTNKPTEELATYLIARAPKCTGEWGVMFLGSSSEAASPANTIWKIASPAACI